MFKEHDEEFVDVTQHGVDPTGTSDVRIALQELIDGSSDGAVLYFPEGQYWTDPVTAAPGAAAITVRKKGLTLTGEGTLRNITFDFVGEASDFIALESGVERGSISFRPPDGIEGRHGDLLQFLSSVSAYTREAGELRAAGPSPSTGILYRVPFSEFSRVHTAGPTATLSSALRFPYPTMEAPSFVRAVSSAGPIVVRGLTFDVRELRRFATLRLDLCSDVTVEDCKFIAGTNPGRQVQTRDCLNVKVKRNRATRMPSSEAKGAGWNSFLFGAGTQDVIFVNNTIEGDRQAFDVTSFDGGHPGSLNPPGPRTSSNIEASRNRFSVCHDALTSHPGTYYVSFCNNVCIGVSTGIRLRSNMSTVMGNQVECARAGMTLSCYLGDTVISGNTLRKSPMPKYPGVWAGVEWIPLTGEAGVETIIGHTLIQGNIIAGTDSEDRLFCAHTYPLLRAQNPPPRVGEDGSLLWFVNNALRSGRVFVEDRLMSVCYIHDNLGNVRYDEAAT